MTHYYTMMDCPVGSLFIQGDGHAVTGLYLPRHKHWSGPDPSLRQANEHFGVVREQLAEYFAGARQNFDVPVKLAGTPFQQRVWEELVKIPFGTTISYAQLAVRVGKPTAVRAVGAANGRNPVSILVPCHRVVGANGKLTGYAGGMAKKEWLLAWERQGAQKRQPGLA